MYIGIDIYIEFDPITQRVQSTCLYPYSKIMPLFYKFTWTVIIHDETSFFWTTVQSSAIMRKSTNYAGLLFITR